MTFLVILLSLFPFQIYALEPIKGLYENSGFHCFSRDSMRLPRYLHGNPQTTDPPFELSVLDQKGHRVSYYEPGKLYTVKLEAYVHFRGLMLQPRLCTPNGNIIGSLRGGKFLKDDRYETNGIDFHQCGRLITNDSITHVNDEKKFLAETKWTTPRDIGNVQFVVTIAAENELYWEKWRPKGGFLRSSALLNEKQDPMLFVYNLHKDNQETVIKTEKVLPTDHPLFIEQKEFLKKDPTTKSIVLESEKEIEAFGFNESVFEQVSAGNVEELENNSGPETPIPIMTTTESTDFTDIALEETAFQVGRIFKKFQPSNETVLRADDLKFLNAHTHLQHDFVDNDIELEDKCRRENPCVNGGTCFMEKGKMKCDCRAGFMGQHCKEVDHCVDNECANNSTCINDPNSHSGYSCQCLNGTVGKLCDVACEPDFCKHGSQCVMKPSGKLGCKCVSGTTGSRCEREINECGFGKCKNNAKCVDLFNDYRCECSPGWMGRNCDRPCKDVYGSCRIWKRDGQCEQMRETTEFFDTNCAASCGTCIMNNDTDNSYLPLQPILLPFGWLLGEWQGQVKGWNNRSTDYPVDMGGMAYNETLTFSVAPPLMFGTPYINYTAVMQSVEDPDDVHMYSGFLTIQQYKDKNQKNEMKALTSVSNTGLVMIEEGELIDDRPITQGGPTLMLHPTYMMYKNGTKPARFPERMKRWFSAKNNRLLQYMYSLNEYQVNYLRQHGEMSPYTVIERHPSQEFIYEPNAEPLRFRDESTVNKFIRSSESQEVINRIPNLRSVMSSDFSTCDTISSRYVVPNVIHPVYTSNSDGNLKSAGNPYAHHPNYTTPSQYFDHIVDDNNAERSHSDAQLTSMDIIKLADPFSNDTESYKYPAPVLPPSDVTLNKKLLSSDSVAELGALDIHFPEKHAAVTMAPIHRETPTTTLNKKLFSADSLYDLNCLVVEFDEKDHFHPTSNLLKIREFSPQSLADLRDLPPLSQYSDFNIGSSKDVATCRGISPTPNDIAAFQYFENVAYGGM
ncbi:unnamed protein product [Caenorhabditis bovis]|uniref:Uncharacterized protein n=1 Tax=Caenorhabditis bovis TaxID=2654633 RepID=A0A8S1ET02_9PELO|nr:unnamed protein product [Caenorhabditis bovis]